MTQRRIPCWASESTKSVITRAKVEGFKFIARGNFIWLVSVPYGIAKTKPESEAIWMSAQSRLTFSGPI